MQNRLKKHWQIKPTISPEIDENLKKYPRYLRQLLFTRKITDVESAREFLEAKPPAGSDPFNLIGMEAAVQRILMAVDGNERMAIYGDYDVDGVTATALMVQSLQALGGNAHGYIPSRFEEGYGLSKDGLDRLAAEGTRLVITVDCGIRSWRETEYAQSIGLDIIVSDHHNPREDCPIPVATAIISPKQPGDPYPEKHLAGVGVAYKIAQALLYTRPVQGVYAEDWLDLAALGTVADLVPLLGENRAIVARGLKRLRERRRQGPASLAAAAGLDFNKIAALTSTDIGFILAPRLNAAGRLESALRSFQLLMSTDPNEAGLLAQQLNAQNQERRKVTLEIERQAEQNALGERPETPLIFSVDADFNTGVVGLAASHLAEAYYRPAIVGTRIGEFIRCSCRSIKEFHMTRALDECADLLDHHGGHAMAAGFTVHQDHLPELLQRLERIVVRELGGKEIYPTLEADLEIHLGDLTNELYEATLKLQPTGYGNPEALFVTRNLRVQNVRKVGSDGKHLKLKLSDGMTTVEAIAFRLGDLAEGLAGQVDVLYSFELNEWGGRRDFQLNVKDIKPSGMED